MVLTKMLFTRTRTSLVLLGAIFISLAPAVLARPPIAPPLPSPTHHHTNSLIPTTIQIPVLYVSVIYLVIDVALWHLPGVRVVINPFKLLTIGVHELSHIIMAKLTGGIVLSITIDPNMGGCTRVQGGHPPSILTAGYLGSTLFGGAMMIGGWDILAAKITSFFIAIALAVPLILVRDRLTIILTAVYEGLLIAFWFVDHGSALRWYSLFVGMMNIFYALWDFLDDRYFNKPNDSDSAQFALMCPRIKPIFWGIFWITWSVMVYVGFTLVGIVAFKESKDEMYVQAAKFLPT